MMKIPENISSKMTPKDPQKGKRALQRGLNYIQRGIAWVLSLEKTQAFPLA